MSLIIGIDNGLSGALVALSDTPGLPPINKMVMPIQSKAGGGIGNEVDIRAVWEWIDDVSAHDKSRLLVVIERPGKHSPGVKALCSMWDSFGRLCAFVELKGLRHHLVNPQTWQKAMLPGCEKGKTKQFALAVCRRLWPGETWIPTARSKVADPGLVDGALIAEWARRANL